jgi:hypothetical protein
MVGSTKAGGSLHVAIQAQRVEPSTLGWAMQWAPAFDRRPGSRAAEHARRYESRRIVACGDRSARRRAEHARLGGAAGPCCRSTAGIEGSRACSALQKLADRRIWRSKRKTQSRARSAGRCSGPLLSIDGRNQEQPSMLGSTKAGRSAQVAIEAQDVEPSTPGWAVQRAPAFERRSGVRAAEHARLYESRRIVACGDPSATRRAEHARLGDAVGPCCRSTAGIKSSRACSAVRKPADRRMWRSKRNALSRTRSAGRCSGPLLSIDGRDQEQPSMLGSTKAGESLHVAIEAQDVEPSTLGWAVQRAPAVDRRSGSRAAEHARRYESRRIVACGDPSAGHRRPALTSPGTRTCGSMRFAALSPCLPWPVTAADVPRSQPLLEWTGAASGERDPVVTGSGSRRPPRASNGQP